MNRCVVESRRAKPIIRPPRNNLIEAQSAQYIPCAHLASVIIARETVRAVTILAFHQRAHFSLGLPRSSTCIVEIRDVMTWLIAMVIELSVKEAVQSFYESCISSHGIRKALHILRNEEGVLPGQTFSNPRIFPGRIKGRDPGAIAVAAT